MRQAQRMPLDLYHWEPTVNSGEILICLREKQVGFASHYVDLLAFEQHAPAFLALNARGEVPVLIHDGEVLTETTLILEYLDAAFPAVTLTPADAADRYRMRVWTKLANDYFAPALTLLGWHLRMAPRLKGRDLTDVVRRWVHLPQDRQAVWRTALEDSYTEEVLARARQQLDIVATRLEESLAAGDSLAGPDYSLADIAIYPLAAALQGLLPEAASFTSRPRLVQWLRRMKQRPAVQGALAMARSARPEEMFAPGPELGRWG